MNIVHFLPSRIVHLRRNRIFHWFMSTNADKSPMDQPPFIPNSSPLNHNTPETRLEIYMVDSLTKPSCWSITS